LQSQIVKIYKNMAKIIHRKNIDKTDFWGITSIVVTIIIFVIPKLEEIEWVSVLKWLALIVSIICVMYSFKKTVVWHRYVFLCICGIIFGINVYSSFVPPAKQNAQRERIAILLPWSQSKQAALEDGKLQLEGVINFIAHNDSIAKEFDFVFLNHENDTTVAMKKVNEELKLNTKYFFSTMSAVNECLSKKFISDPEMKNAILVCAVTSSPEVKTMRNKVYRYYVRSKEEGDKLAMIVDDSIKNATAIVVGDSYGKGAAMAFQERWNDRESREPMEYVYHLPQNANKEKIVEYIKQNIKKIPPPPRAILICHYGHGIIQVISALKDLNLIEGSTLLFTSTAHNDRWQGHINRILREQKNKGSHYYAMPNYEYAVGYNEKKYSDDVKDFSEFAMGKLILSINKVKEKQAKTFDEAWWKTEVPDRHLLHIEIYNETEEADIAVPMVVKQFDLKTTNYENIDNN